ncbi:hypothetical protein [Dyadobacter sp. NIV53]|uniref:hypothetical protein n=1 Tax=Dyadobacter sp. NIV53 TaxID=2861765 RepID=UPI001C87AF91|nr:hypothetical protein [Dyadobacter sp. NIV53]
MSLLSFSRTVLDQFVRIFILANVAGEICFTQNDFSQERTFATAKDFSFQPVSLLCYGASTQQFIFFENFESALRL